MQCIRGVRFRLWDGSLQESEPELKIGFLNFLEPKPESNFTGTSSMVLYVFGSGSVLVSVLFGF